MMQHIDRINDIYHLQPIKLKTDSIYYDIRTIDEEELQEFKEVGLHGGQFKNEFKCSIKTDYEKTYINWASIANNTKKEIAETLQKLTIYEGSAGTGKTFTVKALKRHQIAMTTTNLCARNIDTEEIKADTLYKGLSLGDSDQSLNVYKRLKNKCVWVDEFSMIAPFIWNKIYYN